MTWREPAHLTSVRRNRRQRSVAGTSSRGLAKHRAEDCGTYRFGDSVLRIVSSVPEAGSGFFARFQHRAVHGVSSAELLQISETASSYRVRFRGSTVEEATTSSLISRVARLVLDLEHPDAEPMMFCLMLPRSAGTGRGW